VTPEDADRTMDESVEEDFFDVDFISGEGRESEENLNRSDKKAKQYNCKVRMLINDKMTLFRPY